MIRCDSEFKTELMSLYFHDESQHKISDETIEFCKKHGLLSNKNIPLQEYSAACRVFGRTHPTMGITWAMHMQQIYALHSADRFSDSLREIQESESIVASVTTEPIKGSQFIRAIQEVSIGDSEVTHFERECKIISYLQVSDYLLATFNVLDGDKKNTRLVLIPSRDVSIESSSSLNFIGMKSLDNFQGSLKGSFSNSSVFTREETKVAFEKMIQTGHIGWASVWLGMIDKLLICSIELASRRSAAVNFEFVGRIKEAQIACESMVQHAINNRKETMIINALKSFVSNSLDSLSNEALKLFGMDGILVDDQGYTLERIARDAKVSVCMFPNTTLHTLLGKQAKLSKANF